MYVFLSSLFGNLKAFFCFWFNKRTTQKAAQKLNCFCIRYRLKTKCKPTKKLQKHMSLVKRKPNVKNQLFLSSSKKSPKNATVVFAPRPSVKTLQISSKYMLFNPLTPRSDQHELYLYNINTLTSRQVMRIRATALMQDQILRTNTKRNVWKSLRRIHIHILG